MKIAFLCRSLERGRDGVGDYTRRLAAELVRHGHPSVVVGLNESAISASVFEAQEMEGASVPVLRLPEIMPWGERATAAREWLDAFNPDWVSLQYVPFAFHPKGLTFGFADTVKEIIGSRPLHWMFHELWLLWNLPLPLRQRGVGQLQKACIRRCLRKLKPRAVATQLPLYQAELRKIGIAAELLPLHGNIPVQANGDADQWLTARCAALKMPETLTAGFFGNLLSTLDAGLVAAQLARLNVPKDRLLMLLAGKIGAESARHWESLEQELKASATFHKLGELDEREASYYFSSLDYGLTSYPSKLMNKSGSVAAMREHGLQVIACGVLNGSSARPGHASDQDSAAEGPWTVNRSALFLLRQLEQARL